MLLKALAQFADERLKLPPEMYVNKEVHYVVDLEPTGRAAAVRRVGLPGKDGKVGGRGLPLEVPRLPINRSGPRPKPLLLVDNGEYALGIGREGADYEKVAARHEAFVELARACLEATGAEEVGAVVRFLAGFGEGLGMESAPFRELLRELPEPYDPLRLVTFSVRGSLVVSGEAAKRFWAGLHTDDEGPWGIDQVTGRRARLVKRMPGSVRGVPGQNPSGAKLVAVNKNAFESFGLEAALGASVSRASAVKVDAALNYLLASPEHRLVLGETVWLFWRSSRGAPEEGTFRYGFSPLVSGLLARPSQAATAYVSEVAGSDAQSASSTVKPVASAPEVARLLGELRRGHASGTGRFFALVLSANFSRVVIRDFAWAAPGEILGSLARWFSGMAVIGSDGVEPLEPAGIWALLAATYPQGEDLASRFSVAPAEPLALARAALGTGSGGGPDALPRSVLARCIDRTRKEGVTPRRAQLLRLILTRKGLIGVRELTQLDRGGALDGEDRNAYDLGRLLAQLGAVQRAALGRSPVSTVAERYYGLASTAPSRGLVPALALANRVHLPKLRRHRPGLYRLLNGELEEIMGHLPLPMPASLPLERQGLFALGYYHQNAENAMNTRGRVRARSGASGE